MEQIKCPSCGSPHLKKQGISEYHCDACGSFSKVSGEHGLLVLSNIDACSKCGMVNSSVARFCQKCGAPLWINCPECNSLISGHSEYCHFCGEKIFIDFDDPNLFSIVLENCGPLKIECIKIIRNVTDVGLGEAKTISENTPSLILHKISKMKADEISLAFTAVGSKTKVINHKRVPAELVNLQISNNSTKLGKEVQSNSSCATTLLVILSIPIFFYYFSKFFQ